jgi:hypothetical protein
MQLQLIFGVQNLLCKPDLLLSRLLGTASEAEAETPGVSETGT